MTVAPTLLPPEVGESSIAGLRMTIEEFERLPDSKGFELIDGVVTPKHGDGTENQVALRESETAARINHFLVAHVIEVDAGRVFDSEGLFRCFGDGFGRRPDISFVAKGRLTDEQIDAGASPVAPDLAVEVVSPTDEFIEVVRKTRQYLDTGVRLVWLVNARQRDVMVYAADGSIRRVADDEPLDGGDVLPGFRVPVSRLFPS